MKRVASILIALILSTLMIAEAKHPNVSQSGKVSNVQCIINIMPKMGNIATNPVGVFMEFSACAGDQTWDLMAPFLGGAIRPIIFSVNKLKSGQTDQSVAANFETGFTNLQLYNIVMDMLKQAVGELLGYIEAGAFRYRYSNE